MSIQKIDQRDLDCYIEDQALPNFIDLTATPKQYYCQKHPRTSSSI